MADEPVKAMGGSCLGGFLGAFLGLAIGGFIGPIIATSKNDLRDNRDPQAQAVSSIFDACLGTFGAIIGTAVGGIIGGIGGAVLGAGLATRNRRRNPATPVDEPLPVAVPQPQVDSELARLRDRIAELESQERHGHYNGD